MKPVIALVGRPNVGKSTLFNRLTKTRDALVADVPGLTRDRKYGEAQYEEHHFIVIDTGGIGENETDIDNPMSKQSWAAAQEADIILFLVDARAGLLSTDEELAKKIRTLNKSAYIVANKVDGIDGDSATAEFYQLGLNNVFQIAASHGRGINSLLTEVLQPFEANMHEEDLSGLKGTRIAVVGRPNVGKSTLVNRMLGEDRVVVFDMPGTTRDSIYIPYQRRERNYVLIDTAGVRKRGRVTEMVEKFSVVKALQAISDSHVALVVVDASEGLVDQDLHMLGHVIDSGRALVIVVNKWDGLEKEQKEYVKKEINRRLVFADYAEIHFISALHGTGVGDLYKSIDIAFESANKKETPSFLTKILEDAVSEHQPPLVKGRRIKLRYAHMGGTNPPIIVVHGNQAEKAPEAYKRYLQNVFRKVLKLKGTPLRIEFKKGGENPYASKKKKLTPLQEHKKRLKVKRKIH
jgi:GTP-binding protein